MIRLLYLFTVPVLLAGCISFSSTESPTAPDYGSFCQDKEALCRSSCGDAGVQTFSCKAAPEGVDYQCQCKKPGQKL